MIVETLRIIFQVDEVYNDSDPFADSDRYYPLNVNLAWVKFRVIWRSNFARLAINITPVN
jgi:hypothetical protein